MGFNSAFKGLNAKFNPICHLLALLGAHHILHVGRIRVNIVASRGRPTVRRGEGRNVDSTTLTNCSNTLG
jgi:hypothetical protein